jgi:hypothetical protein
MAKKTGNVTYFVCSEGCSSTDVSVIGFHTQREVEQYKKKSAKNGFNTSEVIEVPAAIAGHPEFLRIANALVKSVFWLGE